VLLTTNVASYTTRYDHAGRPVETAYFGLDGAPAMHADGHAVFRIKYDERGERVEQASFGPDGRPVLHKNGYASMRSRGDPRGRESEDSYHGPDGRLTACSRSRSSTTAGWWSRWRSPRRRPAGRRSARSGSPGA